MKLQYAVSAVVNWRLNAALLDTWRVLDGVQYILYDVHARSLTVHSCTCLKTELSKTGPHLPVYFTAAAFLHVAYKISSIGFTDELMDVLATLAGQFISRRRQPSQCSSELSVSKATKLMKVVANSSRSTMQLIEIELSNATQLDKSELVELLQQSAVEHLATYRQLEAREFGSVATIVTTDFEALYAYKHGDYERCLQLSTQNVHTLLYADRMPSVPTHPEFIQLLDDDIVSLIALTLIANPKCMVTVSTNVIKLFMNDNVHDNASVRISQLTLSLYLMAQCQLKLRHSVTSLTQTLSYIKVAQRSHRANSTLNQLTLKLTRARIAITR